MIIFLGISQKTRDFDKSITNGVFNMTQALNMIRKLLTTIFTLFIAIGVLTAEGGTHTLTVKNDLSEPKTLYYMYTTYTAPDNFTDHNGSVTVPPGEEKTIQIALNAPVFWIDASRAGPIPSSAGPRSGESCLMAGFGSPLDEPAGRGIRSSHIWLALKNGYLKSCPQYQYWNIEDA